MSGGGPGRISDNGRIPDFAGAGAEIRYNPVFSPCCSVIWIQYCRFEHTRNTLDCVQSNYSSRIVFSHIPIEFGQTGISAFDPPTPKTPS